MFVNKLLSLMLIFLGAILALQCICVGNGQSLIQSICQCQQGVTDVRL